MCGINGAIGVNNGVESFLSEMNETMAHRGPDGRGVKVFDTHGLAHVRLSIIDLEAGAQPMKSACEKYHLTFNGEIYNYQELRDDLKSKGETFSTNSDTEVILTGYKVYKEDIVRKLRGMFSFAIVDFERQEYFIARDHFGIKPLFYYFKGNRFLFSSELKPISSRVENLKGNKRALQLYLKHKYVPAPFTIFKDIYKLEKGHYLKVSFEGQIKEKKSFYQVDFSEQRKMSKNEALEEFQSKFLDSVKVHTYSDVPFGVFLSGGVDSSLVSIYLAKVLNKQIPAFNIGFTDESVDESEYAKRLAGEHGLELISTTLGDYSHSEYSRFIKNHFSEPYSDTSCIPTNQVSKLAREHVPMVLGGDGADEAFGGYNSYLWFLSKTPGHKLAELKRAKSYSKMFKINLAERLNKARGRKSYDSLEIWNSIMGYMASPVSSLLNDEQLNDFLNVKSIYQSYFGDLSKGSDLSKIQKCDFETYMIDDVLTKVDRMSMANSLEVRTPFLDKEMANLYQQIPDELKVQKVGDNYHGKYLLKEELSRNMGHDFVYRRKQGFAIPEDSWLSKDSKGYEFMKDFQSQSGVMQELFNQDILHQLFDTNINHRGSVKWLIYSLMIWLEDYPNLTFE